MKTEIKGEKI